MKSSDDGTLSITFSHPAGTFLYQSPPRLMIDDAEMRMPSWGRHRIPVPAGPHRIKVWVPYVLPRKAGRAQTDVTVKSGEEIQLEYMAPAVTFRAGSLGAPGQQKSSGYSTIMVLNGVVAVLAMVWLLIYLLG